MDLKQGFFLVRGAIFHLNDSLEDGKTESGGLIDKNLFLPGRELARPDLSTAIRQGSKEEEEESNNKIDFDPLPHSSIHLFKFRYAFLPTIRIAAETLHATLFKDEGTPTFRAGAS